MANADRIIELLHEAKARPAGAERDQFLDEACRDEPELKEQIVSLLEADADDGKSDFLRSIPINRQTILLIEKPGDRIGRYKLLEQIGEGGCGVVYMADQEEPVRRRVALKVIKLGMDTKQVIARFEAERQALAMMDHPNIAKVLDGGTTETGRPFFVMELVRGIKITDYCDQNNLPTAERLELFIQVCQAIQHAHQKGIIHRDIKPSNILVTQHDDVAVPKVIDFGIAKATVGQLTDKTVFTAFAQFIGTPAYMSPEQAQMSGLDVDTRADIYSLGVLLYELLTGSTPFDAKELLSAGMDEMRRKIREDEPAKPSTCLSTMQAMELTTVAQRRHVEPPKLIHLIRGDLDWLVMKCLEKDRSRRYDTANGLAADIRRHLSSEPIMARPPGRWYEFQKTVRRHKFGFAAAAALICVLGLGVLASTWQALRATRAEREQIKLRKEAEVEKKSAQTEAARSQQVAQVMKDMMAGVGPSVALGRDTAMLREILDKTAERIAQDLKDQPDVEAELRSTMGTVYWELGEFGKASAMHRQALAIQRQRHGNEHGTVAASLLKLGEALRHQRKPTEAEAAFRESLSMRRRLFGNEHPDVVQSLNHLGSLLSIELKSDEPEALLREALATGRKLFGEDHRYVATSLDNLGHVLNRRGQADEAALLHSKALAIQKRLFGNKHPDLIYSYLNLAQALEAQGKPGEAETMVREALSICDRLLGERHPTIPLLRWELGRVLLAQGKSNESSSLHSQGNAFPKDAVTSSNRAESTVRRDIPGEKDSKAAAFQKQAVALQKEGKLAQAEPLFREAITLFKELVRENPKRVESRVQLGHGQWQLGLLLGAANRSEEAEAVFGEALQVFERAARDFPADRFLLQEQAFSHRHLGNIANASGRVDESERHYRASIDLYVALQIEAPANVLYSREAAYTTWMLALILDRAGWADAAASEYDKAIALYRRAVVDFPAEAGLKETLAEVLRQRGNPAK